MTGRKRYRKVRSQEIEKIKSPNYEEMTSLELPQRECKASTLSPMYNLEYNAVLLFAAGVHINDFWALKTFVIRFDDFIQINGRGRGTHSINANIQNVCTMINDQILIAQRKSQCFSFYRK